MSRAHDDAGNLEAVGSPATRSYTYNAANRMATATIGATTASYRYNAMGERVRKTVSSADRYSVHDEAGRWIGDYDHSGNAIQQVVWLGDLPITLLVGSSWGQKSYYIEADALGTPRVVIDPSRDPLSVDGTVVWRWDLEGEACGASAPNQDPDGDSTNFVFDMRFPGQRYDAHTGLNYNYFRDYEPGTGRYVQSDPIGLDGGITTYAYAANSPGISKDPMGLKCNSQGCWNTPEESRLALAGDYRGYYSTACANGDNYACRAFEVSTGTGDGLRGILSSATNYKLSMHILTNQPKHCPGGYRALDLLMKMDQIRRDLALARMMQLQLQLANEDNPFKASRQSIANFHREVFINNFAGPDAFGGDLWDRMNSLSAGFLHTQYDWCEAPSCGK